MTTSSWYSTHSPRSTTRPVCDLPPAARRSAGLLQRAVRLLCAEPARRCRAGVQGLRDLSRPPGCHPRGRSSRRSTAPAVHHLDGSARPPADAQPGQQGVHAPSDHGAGSVVRDRVEHYLSGLDPAGFDVVADFSRAVPRRGHHNDAWCARGEPPAGAASTRTSAPRRERRPGRHERARPADAMMQTGDDVLRPHPAAPRRSARRHDQRADRRRGRTRGRQPTQPGRYRDRRVLPPCSAAPAQRPSPSWSAPRWCCSRGTPTSGRSCAPTAARSPPPSRRCCGTRARCSTTAGPPRATSSARHDHSGRQRGDAARRRRRTVTNGRSPTRTPSISTATGPRRRTSASATASTAASVQPWPGWKCRSRWSACSTSCPNSRSTTPVCAGSP